jgi:hypothetical protein
VELCRIKPRYKFTSAQSSLSQACNRTTRPCMFIKDTDISQPSCNLCTRRIDQNTDIQHSTLSCSERLGKEQNNRKEQRTQQELGSYHQRTEEARRKKAKMAEPYTKDFFNVTFPAEYVAHVEINRPEKMNAFKEMYVSNNPVFTLHLGRSNHMSLCMNTETCSTEM